jgi:NAD(P)H-hydrate epimerase
VVLKGHRTLIGRRDGHVAINASGNQGMAAGGMGDVLTGVIGALLARGLEPFDAARLAVFAHGDAGDRCAHERGQDGMLATDVAAMLPQALAALHRRPS